MIGPETKLMSPRVRGFTLLEIVLALTLALGLTTALLGYYQRAAHIRQLAMERSEEIRAERLVMQSLTRELRSALRHPFLTFGIEGEPDRVRFATAVLPSGNVWRDRTATDDPIPPESDTRIVGYRLRIISNESGALVVEGLERTQQKVPAARVLEEGVQITSTLLTDQIKFLKLRYWNGSEWSETWAGSDLPGGVEITMGSEPAALTAGEEYPGRIYRRVVHIPTGRAPTPDTLIEGLDTEVVP